MQIVRNLNDTYQIQNLAIKDLVQQRINDLGGEAFDATELGYFLVVEAGDTIEAINDQLGFDILCNRMTGVRYDQSGFTPSFEFVEQIGDMFDGVWILDDSGFGIEVLFVPDGVCTDLVTMCQRYAFKECDP